MEEPDEFPTMLADLGSRQKKELVKNYGITWAELQANQVLQEARSLPFDSPRKAGHVRFVAISDTHGKMGRFELPEGDVLLHCGDFSNLGRPQEIEEFVMEFAKTEFKHRIGLTLHFTLSSLLLLSNFLLSRLLPSFLSDRGEPRAHISGRVLPGVLEHFP